MSIAVSKHPALLPHADIPEALLKTSFLRLEPVFLKRRVIAKKRKKERIKKISSPCFQKAENLTLFQTQKTVYFLILRTLCS